MENDRIFDILENLIDGRNTFITNTMEMIPAARRPNMLSRFMTNERLFIDVLHDIIEPTTQNTSTVVRIVIPDIVRENVLVVPSQEQINTSLETIESTTTNCAICQESISSGGCRIRQCAHIYHRSCILTWFGVNVRCPVCRHDIRESATEDLPIQTPSDEE